MLQAIRSESVARQALAARCFADRQVQSRPEAFYLWLLMSGAGTNGANGAKGCSGVEFASYLRSQGVDLVAAAAFSTDGDPPEAVRVCLGGQLSRDDCADALRPDRRDARPPAASACHGDVTASERPSTPLRRRRFRCPRRRRR